MPRLRLVIANKNYSSWSMRPWVLLTQAGIPFEEVALKFSDDVRVMGIAGLSPTGKVPVLWIDEEPVWDSLAILETVAELFPEKTLWPSDTVARHHARSVSAEMHSGFSHLRSSMVMNIRSSYPGKGRSDAVDRDIVCIIQIWEACRARFGSSGELLFGKFSIADAMYAPVATRFRTYGVTLSGAARRYADALLNLDSVRNWCEAARAETDFVPGDEPYAQRP